jgi:putative transcriptional regulator
MRIGEEGMRTSKGEHDARRGRDTAEHAARRSGSAGSKILAAIEEATEILRSEGLESQRLTVRTYKAAPSPPRYGPGDVKRVRELLGVSQAELAGFLGVNVNTVRSWEQGTRGPSPMARRFLDEIRKAPGHFRGRIATSAAGPSPRKGAGEPKKPAPKKDAR